MKKILVICEAVTYDCGAPAVAMNIYEQLKNQYSFDFLVYNPKYNDDVVESTLLKETNIYYFSYKSRISVIKNHAFYLLLHQLEQKVSEIIKKNGPYFAIHCHNDLEAGVCVRAASRKNVEKRIVHSHTAGDKKKGNILFELKKLMCKKMIAKYATDFVACSKMAGENLFGNSKVKIIQNGINNNKYFFCNKEMRDDITFIQVANLFENKNHLFTLDIFYNIILKYPNSKLILVGKGKEKEKIIKKIYDLGLSEKVEIKEDNNVLELLRQSDYFIFPSFREGFGLALLEAQAVGLICFASDTIPSEVQAGNCNFLRLDDGPVVWANEIERYIINKVNRKKSDMSMFGWDYIKEKYILLYDD